MRRIALAVTVLMTSVLVAGAAQEQNKKAVTPPFTLPGPSTPTIPSDAMFALGQQSIQLQAISLRLEKIEPDVAQTRRDVDKMMLLYNAIMYSIAALFTIVASYVVVRLIKHFWPEPVTPS